MAFTVNSTTTNGDWKICDAYTTDCSTSTELVAASSNHLHLLRSITVDIENDNCWFKIFNGTDLQIGPVTPRTNIYHRDYETSLIFSGAINVQTESAQIIHITIAYQTIPTLAIV